MKGRTLRYHKQFYFEPNAVSEVKKILSGIKRFRVSSHFIHRQLTHREPIPVPSKSDLLGGDIFEYYRKGDKIIRFCIRCSNLSTDCDMVYAIEDDGMIVTGWVNCKNDNHRGLNRGAYVTKVFERGDVI